MSGYNLDFTHFDAKVPYYIRDLGSLGKPENGPWNGHRLEIVERATGRVVKAYDYNYHSHGASSFYPFKHGVAGEWFAFFSSKYTQTELLRLKTGEVMATTKFKGGCSWCPTNYYVPAYYQDKSKPSYISEKSVSHFVTPDREFDAETPENYDVQHLHYIDTAFVCGVFWAADYEWLVYRMDIKEIMRTRVIPEPSADTYCFEFDYSAAPEIRQWMKMQDGWWNLGDMDGFGQRRFEYLTQKFTDDLFIEKKEEPAPVPQPQVTVKKLPIWRRPWRAI